MRTINDYINAARSLHNLTADIQLDKKLGFKGASVCGWRKKKALPSPESMAQLAEFAGVDEQEALLELHYWMSMSRQEYKAAAIYKRILEQIKRAASIAAMLVLFLPFSFANASGTMHTVYSQSIHYATIGIVRGL